MKSFAFLPQLPNVIFKYLALLSNTLLTTSSLETHRYLSFTQSIRTKILFSIATRLLAYHSRDQNAPQF